MMEYGALFAAQDGPMLKPVLYAGNLACPVQVGLSFNPYLARSFGV